MLLTKRCGAAGERVAMRVKVTDVDGLASAFFETKTRPVVVAAHSVELSAMVRSVAATTPPARVPSAAAVRSPGWLGPAGPPSATQSPQAGSLAKVMNSGQLASR